MENNLPPGVTSAMISDRFLLLPIDAVQCAECDKVLLESDKAVKRGDDYLCADCADGIPCPNCGEIGGTPRTITSSEFQGDSAHGGMVDWEDEGCSLCIKGRD